MTYEYRVTDAFVNSINYNIGGIDPKVILDIGSRDLEQSIELRSHFPNARIIAFEPVPEQYQICLEKSKQYQNIEVYNYALSDEEGELDFWVVEGNVGGSSLLEPIDVPYSSGTWDKIQVKCRRLDNVLKEIGVDIVDLVWLDVQGVELKVLKGMGSYITGVKAIHTEACPKPYYKGQVLKNELEEFLTNNAYTLEFIPSHDGNLNWHPYGEGDLICIRKMKWESDLTKDIRTFTEFDDYDGGPADWPDGGIPHPLGTYKITYNEYGQAVYPKEVTDCNRFALLQQFLRVRDNTKSILEIGIGRNAQDSFAYVFFNSKKHDTVYIGLDIEDRTFLNDSDKNIYTIQGNSSNFQENVIKFRELGVQKFDFIFIDGLHTINQVLIDWEYTNLLADGGIVGFHDTSCHPGPFNFVNALDQDKWVVEKNICPEDWGIGFAWRK